MSRILQRSWIDIVDRRLWSSGPWDSELEDRAQWEDEATKYPCLAIRTESGMWAGYVAICYEHPFYGVTLTEAAMDGLHAYGGITSASGADGYHFIELEPPDPNHTVDVDDPKESTLNMVRLPLNYWFFGFDTAHANDLVPGMSNDWNYGLRKKTYKDLEFIKKECSKLAWILKNVQVQGHMSVTEGG